MTKTCLKHKITDSSEAAELHDLPHANICKGRGRCGTCRVRINALSQALPESSELEKRTLERFDSPPDVRLACQLVPTSGKIELERMLPPDAGLDALLPPSKAPEPDVEPSSEAAT